MLPSSRLSFLICLSWSALSSFAPVLSAGLDRNGLGSASMGVAGAVVGGPTDALSAMSQNPAALSEWEDAQLQLGGTLAVATGDFYQRGRYRGSLEGTWGILPDFALVSPINEKAGLGLSLTTDTTRLANWEYDDEPGALAGARYRTRTHRSEILNLRAAIGLGVELGGGIHLGASLGGVYTRNRLQAPYIFQSNALAGAKTQLDLETDGFGVNGDLALLWKMSKNLSLGLSYRTPTRFTTEGFADGDVDAQVRALGIRNVPTGFRYDAEVPTQLPQKISAGFNARVTTRTRVLGQVDWVNWSAAYSDLEVRLLRGNNRLVNGLAGSNRLQDVSALDWEDRFVFRLGTEIDLSDRWVLRLGYAYGQSPVPSETLLPMTAAITEHTLACGLGWKHGRLSVDLGWQYDLPISRRASATRITGPEYRDTSLSLETQWVGLTIGFEL